MFYHFVVRLLKKAIAKKVTSGIKFGSLHSRKAFADTGGKEDDLYYLPLRACSGHQKLMRLMLTRLFLREQKNLDIGNITCLEH